jgi:hypothetical protein
MESQLKEVLKSLSQWNNWVLAKSRCCRMFNRCLLWSSMHLWVPFIAPRDLGAIRAPFGRPWLPSVRRCTRLSGAQWTVQRLRIVWLAAFLFWGAPDCPVGGTRLSGAPIDCWTPTDVASSRWLLAHCTVRRYARTVRWIIADAG